jgi:prophage regulatory protein
LARYDTSFRPRGACRFPPLEYARVSRADTPDPDGDDDDAGQRCVPLFEVIVVVQPSIRLLRRPEVEARVGLSTSTIRRLIARGEFPPPIRISARLIAWNSRAIDAWIRGADRSKGGGHAA